MQTSSPRDQLAGVPASRIRLCVVLTCALLVGACGKSEPPAKLGTPDQATLNYGYGAVPNDAVTYQPDVIIVGGGPQSIVSASADGLVWIIDGDAPNARDLRPGKMMLATSKATGRIMKVEPRGDDLAVTLGPFELGDILRDADIQADFAMSPDNVAYQVIPELPGMYRDYKSPNSTVSRADYVSALEPTIEHDASGILLRFAPIRLAVADSTGASAANGALFPPTSKEATKITIGDWEAEPSYKTQDNKQRIGLKILKTTETKVKGKGLKAGIDIGIWVNRLHIKSRTKYSDGKLDADSSTFEVEGLEGIDFDLSGGIAEAGDNMKVRIELPFVWEWPIPAAGGFPLMGQLKMKFIFETALGGNNATLHAAGKYQLKGPLGIENGTAISPDVAEIDTSRMINAVTGLSLGVSAFIFTQETRFLVGIGPPVLFVGPYAKIVSAVGITKAADIAVSLGSPLCRAVTVKMDAGTGIGGQVSSALKSRLEEIAGTATGYLEKKLGKGAKAEVEAFEQTATFYNETQILPKIGACRV